MLTFSEFFTDFGFFFFCRDEDNNKADSSMCCSSLFSPSLCEFVLFYSVFLLCFFLLCPLFHPCVFFFLLSIPLSPPSFMRPLSSFYKAREGLVSRLPEMAGIVEARDRGFRNGIVGIVAVIC